MNSAYARADLFVPGQIQDSPNGGPQNVKTIKGYGNIDHKEESLFLLMFEQNDSKQE